MYIFINIRMHVCIYIYLLCTGFWCQLLILSGATTIAQWKQHERNKVTFTPINSDR